MPWEITLRPSEAELLGIIQAIKESLSAALPGISFSEEPSGLEKIEEARRSGVEFPVALRDVLLTSPSTHQALYEEHDLTFEFLLGGEETVSCIEVCIRGNGDPIPALSAFATSTGWVIWDDASGEIVPLDGTIPQGLTTYRKLMSDLPRS